MTETEKQIKEIHGMMCVVTRLAEDHNDTLYGKDGNLGVEKDLLLVKQTQTNCVARKGNGRANVLFAIQIILCVVALTAVIISLRQGT